MVSAGGEEREVDAIIFGTGFDIGAASHGRRGGIGGKRLGGEDGASLTLQGQHRGRLPQLLHDRRAKRRPRTQLLHLHDRVEHGVHHRRAQGTARAAAAFGRRQGGSAGRLQPQAAEGPQGHGMEQRLPQLVPRPQWQELVLWPGFTFAYRWITRRFDIDNYTVRKSEATRTFWATSCTSTRKPKCSAGTGTTARAGLCAPKMRAYSALKAGQCSTPTR